MFSILKEWIQPKDALCMILTEQEGAEIWCEGKKTGLKTPSMLSARVGQVMRITLKKPGYQDVHHTLQIWHQTSYVYHEMQKYQLRVIRGGLQSPALAQTV